MIIAGFDPGWRNINYAMINCMDDKIELIRWGQLLVHDLGPKDFDNPDIYLSYVAHKHYNAIDTILNERPVVHYAFIEKPLHIQNGETTIKISIAASAILFGCKGRGINSEFVNNNTWKKRIVGNGNANKEMIKVIAIELFDLGEMEKESWDIYDASLIARYGVEELLDRAKDEDKLF